MILGYVGVDLSLLHPVYMRRLEAMREWVGEGSVVSGVRTYEDQQRLYAKYKAGTGNTAANPDRVIGERTMFGETFTARGSWHMQQETGWGYATDWSYSGMTPAAQVLFAQACPWNVPGWRTQAPSRFGLCRDVGPTARNPDGEPWHVKPDPRVPTTSYDEDDMTDDDRRLLQETLARLKTLTPELKVTFVDGKPVVSGFAPGEQGKSHTYVRVRETWDRIKKG